MGKNYSIVKAKKGLFNLSLNEIYDEAYTQGFEDGSKDKAAYCELNFNHGVNKGYEDGLNDAWECARKLVLSNTCGGLELDEIEKIFGNNNYPEVIRTFSASECMAKIKEYEENKKVEDEIKVGDEVDHDGLKSVAVKVWQNCICTISQVGTTPYYTDKSVLKKTGRHFDEIEKVLKQLQGE